MDFETRSCPCSCSCWESDGDDDVAKAKANESWAWESRNGSVVGDAEDCRGRWCPLVM